MTHSDGVGGSSAHDRRREGTVSPRDHNPQGADTGGGAAEEQLADPNRPHRTPSSREERRAEERAAAKNASGDDRSAADRSEKPGGA